MYPSDLPKDVTATLLWFPAGQTPVKADFVQTAGSPHAEKWWFRHEALIDAVADIRAGATHEGREPWMLTDDTVRDRAWITSEYGRLTDG